MDFLTIILIGIVTVLAVGLLGFAIPAGLRKPLVEQEENVAPSLPEDLPPLVRRWLEGSGLDKTAGGNLAAWGLGKLTGPTLPLIGQLWMPLRWTLHLQPGEAFVWRTQITWWRRRFISGGDMFYEGKGIFDMGANQLDGKNMDGSQFTPLWVYSLFLAPAVALNRPGLAWKDETENTVTLQVPFSVASLEDSDASLEETVKHPLRAAMPKS
jgi:hypothetical protein